MRSMLNFPAVLGAAILLLLCAGCQRDVSSNEQLTNRYVHFWNTGKFDGIEEVLHPDFELRMSPEFLPEQGRENFMKAVERWRTAYPDFKITVHELVYDAGKIAARWTVTATNTGPGINPPTGRHVEVMGLSIFHIEGGMLRDEWIAGNDYLWMKQLGFTFVPPVGGEQ